MRLVCAFVFCDFDVFADVADIYMCLWTFQMVPWASARRPRPGAPKARGPRRRTHGLVRSLVDLAEDSHTDFIETVIATPP